MYTPLQSHFLMRLSTAVAHLEEYQSSPNPDRFLLRVLKRAIYSYLRDCIDEGVGEEAKQVLQQASPHS